MDEHEHIDLLHSANSAASRLRRAARLVEYAAALSIALLIGYLIGGAVGWAGFTGLLLLVLTSGLLAGRAARARSIALEIAAAQLELSLSAQRRTAGSSGERRP
jgi:hypothetical protein